MEKNVELKDLYQMAEEKGIEIEEIKKPELRFGCMIMKRESSYRAIVLNLYYILNETAKAKALEWALHNCLVNDSKTKWRYVYERSTLDSEHC